MASSGSVDVAGGGGLHEGLGVVDRVAQVPPVEDADDAVAAQARRWLPSTSEWLRTSE